MTELKISLFGEFRAWREGELIQSEAWNRQKTRSLLKLLLTRPGRPFSKDEIIDALWPGVPTGAADLRLRMTVSLLRRALEPDLERGSDSRYVRRKRPGYYFDRQADCRTDTWEFEEHQRKAEAFSRNGKLDEAIQEYRAALDLVKGDFLAEDPYEDWAMEAREEWDERRLSVLSELADCLAQKGNYTEAIEHCERALGLDEHREELHRRLMLYHYCAGEQILALRAYRDYARLLKQQLGTEPSPELARLKEQVEARDVPGIDEGRRRYPRPRRPLRFPYSLSRTHFAGREKEYGLLAELLRETTDGRGGTVAVEGEAGVGKTRLVEEFLGHARSRDVRVFAGRCYERELGAPLEPVVEALEPLPVVEEMLPEAPGAGFAEAGYPPGGRPHDDAHVYRILARGVIQESRDTGYEGLILFLDDVQWADSSTLDFLSYLARRIRDERILLVFTHRREDTPELSGWLYGLAGRRLTTGLSLERLSREELAQILRRMASRAFGEMSLLVDFLHRESEGNPFYAVEYLRWLIESGTVDVDPRRRISSLKDKALQKGILPSGVQALIEARLRSLDEETRSLLETAAVVGRGFDLELLCGVAGCEEEEAFDAIKSVMDSGLLTEAAEGSYALSHDKLRQGLYDGVGRPRRRRLHLRVADALKKVAGEPAELAHHYLRARAWQPALENLVQAARKAEEGYAWGTALQYYARAIEVLDNLPESATTRFELLKGRERLLEHMDRREERVAAVEEMFELAKRSGEQSRIAEVHLRRIGALAALSDLEGAKGAGKAAIAIFQELGDRAGEARVHREVGYSLWMDGDYDEALEEGLEALRIHRELDDRQGEAGSVWNIVQIYRGMGDYERALAWAKEAVEIYGELGDRYGESMGKWMRTEVMATIARERGDLKSALSLGLRSLRYRNKLGAGYLDAAQHNNCGSLYLRLGDPKEALGHFRIAARLSRETGSTRDEGHSVMNVGISLEQTGDYTGAARAYRQAAGLLEAAHEELGMKEDLSGKANALGLLANLLHRSLDLPGEALEACEASARIHRDLGDTHRLRKTLLQLSGLRWRTGDLEGSASGYEEALQMAREQGEPVHEAAALASLSVVYRDLDRLRESIRYGQAARELLKNLGDFRGEAYVLSSLAESHNELGRYKSALACIKRSLRLRRKIGDEEGELKALRYTAEVYEKLGDEVRAREASKEAARKEEELRAVSDTERGN
jgi:DNA-binding SARP family transcriptional activator